MRYWIISYSYALSTGFGFGNCTCHGDEFPPRKSIEEFVRSDSGGKEITGFSIMNIIEISEKDYNSYTTESHES